MINHKKVWIKFVSVCMLLLCACCMTPKRPPMIGNDDQTYGIVEGLFQHRWWNYYERGQSFTDGALTYYLEAPADLAKAMHYLKIAEADFTDAISLRRTDQFRARTYGMHFLDYFPHRERGIVYYYMAEIFRRQKKADAAKEQITKARHEIEISLYGKKLRSFLQNNVAPNYSSRTEKAIVYLQKIQALQAQLYHPDKAFDFYVWQCPKVSSEKKAQISIWHIHPRHMTYLDEILIQGRIQHHTNIDRIEITINDQSMVAPITGKDVHFFKMVKHLSQGKNEIQVTCIDTNNRSFQKKVLVERKAMDFSTYNHQLRLKIKPLEKQTNPLLANLEQKISQCMQEKQRFKVLSKDSAPAECMLSGRTNLQKNSLELAVELIETETSHVMVTVDAYIENMNQYPDKMLSSITKNIHARLADAYPILSGNIVGIDKKRMIARVKYHHQVRDRMKVLLCDKFADNGGCVTSSPCFGRIEKIKEDIYVRCERLISSGVFITR